MSFFCSWSDVFTNCLHVASSVNGKLINENFSCSTRITKCSWKWFVIPNSFVEWIAESIMTWPLQANMRHTTEMPNWFLIFGVVYFSISMQKYYTYISITVSGLKRTEFELNATRGIALFSLFCFLFILADNAITFFAWIRRNMKKWNEFRLHLMDCEINNLKHKTPEFRCMRFINKFIVYVYLHYSAFALGLFDKFVSMCEQL